MRQISVQTPFMLPFAATTALHRTIHQVIIADICLIPTITNAVPYY